MMTVTGRGRDRIAGMAAPSGSSACMADLLRERRQPGERGTIAEPEVLGPSGGVLPVRVGEQVEMLAAASIGVIYDAAERVPGRGAGVVVAAVAAVEGGLPLRAIVEIMRGADLGTEDGDVAVLDQFGDLGLVGVMVTED